MHFCHISTLSITVLAVMAAAVALYFLCEDTWRRLLNKPKRLNVPIKKEEAE